MRYSMYGLLAAVGLVMIAGIALADDPPADPTTPAVDAVRPVGWGPAFVDEDGDGVCDYWARGWRGWGRGMGQGPAMVDEDGDGVCDYWARGGRGWGRGMGRGMGRGRRAPAASQ